LPNANEDAIKAAPGDDEALAAALRLLAGKRLTKLGLAQKLRHRGFASSSIQAAVAACEERGFVDDRSFAQLYVAGVLERKAVGRMRLFQELRKHGIDADTARDVLDGTDEDEDDRIDRALARLESLRPQDGYGQLGRRLERLGFAAPAIARALRRRADQRGPFPRPSDFEEHR
jgi:regulatory protein